MMTLTLSNYLLRRTSAHKLITVVVATVIGVGLRFLLKNMFPQMSEKVRSTIVTIVVIIIVMVAIFVFPSN